MKRKWLKRTILILLIFIFPLISYFTVGTFVYPTVAYQYVNVCILDHTSKEHKLLNHLYLAKSKAWVEDYYTSSAWTLVNKEEQELLFKKEDTAESLRILFQTEYPSFVTYMKL